MTRHASDCRCADCLDGENRVTPAPGVLTKPQRLAIAGAIRSLRYGCHPHRSPHADELAAQFPDINLWEE